MIGFLAVVALSVFFMYIGMGVRGVWRTAEAKRHEGHPEPSSKPTNHCGLCQQQWWLSLTPTGRMDERNRADRANRERAHR